LKKNDKQGTTSSSLKVKDFLMDIAQLAKRCGLPASTLRFYEEKGLIRSVGRRGLRRTFGPLVLERLALIALGRLAGFSLNEIARMLGPDGEPQIDRKLLADKADEIDRSIQKLTAMRNGLRHAAVCSAPSYMACPSFRRLLGVAAAGVRRGKDSASPGRKKRKASLQGG